MNLNSTAIAGCLNYFRHGPPPFIRARSSLSPTPNYKIICATFSFKPTAPLCNSQHLTENTTWSAVTITRVYCTTIAYILCTTVYSIYGTMWCIYSMVLLSHKILTLWLFLRVFIYTSRKWELANYTADSFESRSRIP